MADGTLLHQMVTELLPVLAEVWLLLGSFALLVLVLAGRRFRVIWNTTIVLILGALYLQYSFWQEGLAAYEMLQVNYLTHFAKIVILLGTLISLLTSYDYLRTEKLDQPEYCVLIIIATLGMLLMVSANTLLAIYVALELQSLCLFILAGFHRQSVRSAEAGLKYFVLGALASGIMLYGMSLTYGASGTLTFTGIAALQSYPHLLLMGMALMCVGFAFKVSAVPFHMWTPDVYEGAPMPITGYFATAAKFAALILFAQVLLGPFSDVQDQWQPIVLAISVLSMAWGAVAAIGQRRIKRLLAYSSIGHVGYALVGLAVATTDGLTALLIYMAIYVVTTGGVFGCLMRLRKQGVLIEEIEDLAGLGVARPTIAFGLLIFVFSLAGIPPLAGFFGKLIIFGAALDAGYIWLAVFAALTSVVGAFYYLRLIKIMYFDEAPSPWDRPATQIAARMTIGVCAVIVTLFLLIPQRIYSLADRAVDSFLPF
ncbi:MAG: NADH-quinone oxidoreductase subunit NuoN [Pseudomonadota bacterium]